VFQYDLDMDWLDQKKDLSRAEIRKRLSRMRSLCQMVLEMGTDGILILDEEVCVEYANRKAEELTGIKKDRLLGTKFDILLNDVARLPWLQIHSELVSRKEDSRRFLTEFLIKRPDGSQCTVEACVSVARTDVGRKTFVYLREQTLKDEIMDTLRRTNVFLSNIIRSSVDGIMASDIKGNVTFFNEYAERMLGYRSEDVVGKMHISTIYSDPAEAREIMAKIRSEECGGVGKLTTTQVNLKDRESRIIPCNLSAAMIYEDGQEKATVGIFTDLRERIRMERELEETHLQLVQSEKMASLGKLAAGVAHEINNPLGGILMYANILMEDMSPDSPGWKDLEHIVEQTLRCKDIVQNLLDFSRQSGTEQIYFSVNECVQKVVSLFKDQSMLHDIRIVLELDLELPRVLGNPGLMNQVLTNLLVNAVDAMEGEGVLTFRSRADYPQGVLVVEVEDTGCGIPEELLSRVFDPFFTTKKVGKGTGLGLATSYGIVKRHGGRLMVKSVEGMGSIFRVELPIPPDESSSLR